MRENIYNQDEITPNGGISDNKLQNSKTEFNTINTLEKDAFNLYRQAEIKLAPGCCLDTLFTSKTTQYNDAYNLYIRAGEKYKMCNQWTKASDCYEKCAHIKMDLKENALDSYKEAYFCSQKTDLENNTDRLFAKMMNYLSSNGEYYEAGKLTEKNGEKYENEKKYNAAINSYLKAIEFYEMDNSHNSTKNNCLIKLADLMVINDHPDAAKKVPSIYENIGKDYLKNNLTKYSANEYFGKAILSVIYYSNDLSEGNIYINKYKEIAPSFEDTSMCRLCVNCANAMENKDSGLMKKGIKEYKDVNEIDNFMGNIFIKLINKVQKFGGQAGNIIDNEDDYK